MKLRFFKTLWHDITLMIVLTGLLDMLVMTALENSLADKKESVGRKYIRITFILSRFLRLLGLVESVPVGFCLTHSLMEGWVERKSLRLCSLDKIVSGLVLIVNISLIGSFQ